MTDSSTAPVRDAASIIACQLCGRAFECRPGPKCWCAQVPFQPMPTLADRCLCPDCLAARHDKAG